MERIEFKGYLLEEDEIEAMEAVLKEIRKKKKHSLLILKIKNDFSVLVSESIDAIGLADTKVVVREINRKLRDMPVE